MAGSAAMCFGGGGVGGGGFPSRGGSRKVSLIVFPCMALACGLVLQGCDSSSYFEEPDEVDTDESAWEAKELKHTPRSEYFVDAVKLAEDCSGAALEDALKRTTVAYRREVQMSIPEDVPDDARTRHINDVFAEDSFRHFVTDEASGYLNKDRVFCRVLRYFPELPHEDAGRMMLDHVQTAVSQITQFVGIRERQWKAAKGNATIAKAIKGAYGLEDLSDEHFIALRDAVLPVEEEYNSAILHAIETFARGTLNSAGCLQHYFTEVRQEPCLWLSKKRGDKEIEVIGTEGIEVVNRDALMEVQRPQKQTARAHHTRAEAKAA